MFSCKVCSKVYKSKDSLQRHTKYRCNKKSVLLCEYCGKLYSKLTFTKHLLDIHNLNMKTSSVSVPHQTSKHLKVNNCDFIICDSCGIDVKNSLFNSYMRTNEHK